MFWINGTVLCLADRSCQDSNIFNARNIYCAGYISCDGSAINSNGSDIRIYLTGYQSGRQLSIYCPVGDECFIFCDGASSCSKTNDDENDWDEPIQCYGNGSCTVMCTMDSGCPPGYYPTQNPSENPTSFDIFC